MKSKISGLLFLLSFNVCADDTFKFLSKFAVFSSSNIRVKCSDFLGNVASGGDAQFEHFLVNQEDSSTPLCPVNARNRVTFVHGAVSKGRVEVSPGQSVRKGPLPSCIAADKIYTEKVSYFNHFGKKEVDFISLSDGLKELETKLIESMGKNDFQVIELSKDSFLKKPSGHQELRLKNDGRPLIIISQDQEVRISHTGLFFNQEAKVDPSKIFWYFPNASYMNVFRSGISSHDQKLKSLGIPGVIVAPGAQVNFNEVLITGAVYSDSLTGGSLNRYDFKTCDLSAGQINYIPFNSELFSSPVPVPEEQDQRVPRCRGKKCPKG